MKKKSLLLSLACAMLILLFGMTANAQSEDTLEPYSYTNPAYANLESDTDSASDSIAPYSEEVVPNASYTSDVDALAGTLRQQMVSRAAVINLYYHHDSVLTQAVFDQLCDDLFAKAIAHTGVGKEGDYILWNCQRYTVGATQEASSQGSGYDVHITFTFTYLTDASQEAEVDQAVANLLKTLDLSGKTDYQKIKAIYDYICSNITYDYDNLYDDSYTLKHSSYAALINKKAVCQGYASLFYRLALEAGIDARVISGDSNGPHAWNIVKIEGSYYNLDSTWDAGNTEYEYFLKNAKDFPNHTRDAAYTTAAFTSSYPIAATSYAVHGSIQDYEYKITNNGQVIITKYTGNDADVTTPATIADMPVIGIDKKAFFDLPNLETLTISEGVQSVSDTFTGNVPKLRQIHFPSTLDFRTPDGSDYHILGSCPSLEEITVPDNSPYLYAENGILYDSAQYTVLCSAQNADLGDLVLPENVQIINTHAFEYNTHLTSIQMPDCVYLIGYQAFESCVNLVSANIPRSLGGMGIGLYAFENTSLQSLFIPKEIEDIYITGYQFAHKALQEIKVEKGNPNYKVIDGALIYEDYEGKTLVMYASGSKQTSYTLPNSITFLDVKAFDGAENLETITLTGNISTIPSNCFQGCTGLKELTIPEGVTSIDSDAFKNCTNLQKIYLPKSLTTIDSTSFSNATNITDIYYAGTQKKWEKIQKNGAFNKITATYHYNDDDPLENGQWLKSGSRWWYRYGDGSYPSNQLCQINNIWYGFDASGWMETGWAAHDNKWYYFNTSGVMQTGWLKLGGSWYYLDPDKGYMYADTAFSLNDHIYGFNTDGTMYTGWCYIPTGNYWLYFDNNGAVNGWKSIGGKWYFFNYDYRMISDGWYNINGVEYYFLSSGAMADGWAKVNGEWYYCPGGKEYNGWLSSGGNWYYISESQMVYGGIYIIDNRYYSFANNGVWLGYANPPQ